MSHNFADLSARQRAKYLLDHDSFHELLGPFDRVISPWLERQGIVPQFDDGVVIAKGRVQNRSAVVIAIEGAFQGGSLGEVAGAKIAGALELALEDCLNGRPTAAILVLETGGVRLQEANLGLAAIAEIQSAIVALREHQPVIGVVTGPVGCFGGMSIAAGMCSYLMMTREGRLGLNGPQVIEQEAGIAEYNAQDRPFIWSLSGGEQRFSTGFVDACTGETAEEVRAEVCRFLALGRPAQYRTDQFDEYLARLQQADASTPMDAELARKVLTPNSHGTAPANTGAKA